MNSIDTNARRNEPGSTTGSLRVLVLHQHYWPETAATAQILSDLCEDLAQAGHEVTVVCGQPSYRTRSAQRLPAKETHHGVNITRVWSYVPSERTIPNRVVQYCSYFASSLVAALAHGQFDVCFVMSTPPLLLGVSGGLLRALRGVPFVYSVQDLYPDVAIHLGVIRRGSAAARMIEAAASACYRAAAAVVTLSPAMAERLAAKGVSPDKLHVLPNWADTKSITPLPRDNAFSREHGLVGGFVAQYSGNIGLSQGLEAVVSAAARLRDVPIRFAIVGDGNARSALQARCQYEQLSNVLFLPPQPRDRLSELLASCDVGLVPMKRGVAGDLVPSKLYGIMAASRPVLASVEVESEAARVVREHRCGFLCAPEDPDALAAELRNALQMDRRDLQRKGSLGRAACAILYARSEITPRYARVLQLAAKARFAQPTQDHASRESDVALPLPLDL